jgi:hypothetical protein
MFFNGLDFIGERTMLNRNLRFMKLAMLFALPIFFLITNCSEVKLNTIPPPALEAKLRIFIQPTSDSQPRKGWGTPYKKYEKKMYKEISQQLAKKGMYEVVPRKDVQSVLGREISNTWYWKKNDWALARRVGKSLYAQYAMIFERGCHPFLYWRAILINLETGKRFEVFSRVTKGHRKAYRSAVKASYREIFRDAKKDLMATAIRIGKRDKVSKVVHTPPPPRKVPASIQEVEKPPVPPKEPRTSESLGRQVDLSKAFEAESAAKGRTQIAVYDLDSAKNLKIVALILSEALREELFRLGNFILVNRENMNQVLQEIKLGQTGLIDEKQAIQAGKALAVNQIIVGRLASIGKSSLLQAKRINTETHSTMAISSLKCKQGNEEVLLDRIEELAGKLVQSK